MNIGGIIHSIQEAVKRAFEKIVDEVMGYTVPGVHIDPLLNAMLMGQIASRITAENPERADEIRAWSQAQWSQEVADYIASREGELEPVPDPGGAISGTPPVEPPEVPTEFDPGQGPEWLSGAEREAWARARHRSAELARGLGNKISAQTGELLMEEWQGGDILAEVDPAERARKMEMIREMTAEAVARRDTADELAGRLANATGDYSRNWLRIARTELQGAYNEGAVINIMRTFGRKAQVARVPNRSACVQCRRVFLDRRGRPAIFSLDEIVDNDTNADRRAGDWEATVWPVHPNCRCDVQYVPDGFGFNDGWDMVPLAEVEAERSAA